MAETTKAKAMSLAQKMLELQKAVRGLSPDSENKGFRYTYISGSKLLGVVRPKMDELGLTLTQTIVQDSIQVNIIPQRENSANVNIFFIVRFVWHNADTGESKEDLWPSYGQNTSLDKAIGCAMTYSERYYIMKQLHIATDKDDIDSVEPEKVEETQTETKPSNAPSRRRNAVLEQKNGQESKNVHITMEMVNAGNCKKAVQKLIEGYDAAANGFSDSVKADIKSKYDWDEDAYSAVLQMATNAVNSQII